MTSHHHVLLVAALVGILTNFDFINYSYITWNNLWCHRTFNEIGTLKTQFIIIIIILICLIFSAIISSQFLQCISYWTICIFERGRNIRKCSLLKHNIRRHVFVIVGVNLVTDLVILFPVNSYFSLFFIHHGK